MALATAFATGVSDGVECDGAPAGEPKRIVAVLSVMNQKGRMQSKHKILQRLFFIPWFLALSSAIRYQIF